MIELNELCLVNYCHPDCVPLKNIMRLPKEEAFALAAQMAEAHPETTAFYRFADFENYYRVRCIQDELLYSGFTAKGGEPEEKHPLSFVIAGSDYLFHWFADGNVTKIPLSEIEPRHISFTIGDGGAMCERDQKFEVLTFSELQNMLDTFDGTYTDFVASTGRKYIEAQLWSDRYI